jgi:hypothetical protein
LIPQIVGHDINFGAFNAGGPPEWSTNGLAPDTLTFVPGDHHEATAYWPAWPAPPVLPIFGGGGIFGGDFTLNVMFTGQDAPYVGPGGTLDVSLTGTGASAGAPDLMIFGSIGAPGPPVLLWALDLELVSLYGYSFDQAYVLEGLGVIVGGTIAHQNNLIGRPGAMRGHLDFLGTPWIPPMYDPIRDPRQNQFRADYSGETGLVPEPGTMIAIGAGLAALISRRRR